MNERDKVRRIPPGKLPAVLLRKLLKQHAPGDPRVVVGPGIGMDAAVIDMGDRYLVAKSDPVTFATDEIGWYAVQVNANDVACCGAVPRWFLATLLLPESSTTSELAEAIFAQLAGACRELGVSLCGGHTEITYGLNRPIVVGHMLGEAPREQYITSGGARIGDALVVTKGIAIEGTALIAREMRQELRDVVDEDILQRSVDLLHSPGISVVRDAQLALEVGGVHALHDPTEGGIVTGLRELAEAAGVGLLIEEQRLPVLPECEILSKHLGFSPLGLIASGSLLISTEKQQTPSIIERLQRGGMAATEIGCVLPPEHGCLLRSASGSEIALPMFDRDEIARVFGQTQQ